MRLSLDLGREILTEPGNNGLKPEVAVTPEREIELLRKVAVCAEFTLIEQRREFARGDFGDLDALEDALNAWEAARSATIGAEPSRPE